MPRVFQKLSRNAFQQITLLERMQILKPFHNPGDPVDRPSNTLAIHLAKSKLVSKIHKSGEIPKAFVVKSTGSSIKESEVMEYIAEKVATFKQIRDVEFVETIPKNPSGKILRRLLKNPV